MRGLVTRVRYLTTMSCKGVGRGEPGRNGRGDLYAGLADGCISTLTLLSALGYSRASVQDALLGVNSLGHRRIFPREQNAPQTRETVGNKSINLHHRSPKILRSGQLPQRRLSALRAALHSLAAQVRIDSSCLLVVRPLPARRHVFGGTFNVRHQ